MKPRSAFVPSLLVRPTEQPKSTFWKVSPGRQSSGRYASRQHFRVQCNGTEKSASDTGANQSDGRSGTNLTVPLIIPRTARTPAKISYGTVVEQAGSAIEALAEVCETPSSLKLTVDFPPERSETRAGTLVSRFENNFNFVYALAKRLGVASDRCQRVGPLVEIRDNVNPQGGGEYLTDDECMVGVRLDSSYTTMGKQVTILLNAGVDASTLKQIQKYDTDEKGIIILVNCALDRVSWFAKLGFAKYIDSFSEAYYLKQVPPAGWLLKCAPEPWTVFVQQGSILKTVQETVTRPSLIDVQSKVRLNAG